jgi:hypothetical protein
MRDSTEPIDSSKSDAPPRLELGQHLMRRRTEPLGVIDVRQPEQHYARTAGWIAQRFALLEHWKTRYGSDEDPSTANAGMVFAALPPLVAPGTVVSSPAQLVRSATQSVASPPSAAATASSSSSPSQFRVRRRAATPTALLQRLASPASGFDSAIPPEVSMATFDSSDIVAPDRTGEPARHAGGSPQHEETSLPTQLADESPSGNLVGDSASATPRRAMPLITAVAPVRISRQEAGPAPSPRGELRGGEVPDMASQPIPAPSALILPKRLPGGVAPEPEMVGELARNLEHSPQDETAFLPTIVPDQPPSGDQVDDNASVTPRRALPLAAAVPQEPVSRLEASSLPLPLHIQRQASPATTELARGQETMGPIVATATDPVPLAMGNTGPARELTRPMVERSAYIVTGTAAATVAPAVDFLLVQRQAADSMYSSESVPGEMAERRQARATEIRATPSEALQPTMAWRQSAGTVSSVGMSVQGTVYNVPHPLPLAIHSLSRGEMPVARQPMTGESTTSTTNEDTQPLAETPIPAFPPANEIDVGHLAAQVSRLIAHQLVIERERRGRGR